MLEYLSSVKVDRDGHQQRQRIISKPKKPQIGLLIGENGRKKKEVCNQPIVSVRI